MKEYQLYRSYTPWLFLLIPLLLMILIVFYPMLKVMIWSFYSYDVISEPIFVGFSNYIKLFRDPNFFSAVGHTITFFVMVIPFTVFLPLLLALIVNNKLKGVTFFRASYYLPVIISMVIVGITWRWLYDPKGIINFLLLNLNAIDKPIAWLSNTTTALFAVIAVTIWKGLGYYMVIYLAGLQSISEELYEAADIDGASLWQKHTKITLPLMFPYIVVVATMSAISALKVFDEIFIMTNGGPAGETETVVFYLFREFIDLEVGYACAVGVVLFFTLLIFSMLAYMWNNKKSVLGS